MYEGDLLCVLDFYVHPSVQRMGHGRALFDFMLRCESTSPTRLAFDSPTTALLAFLDKHYQLSNPIWQNTNLVVFPQLFQDVEADAGQGQVIDMKRVPDSGNNTLPDGWSRPTMPRSLNGRGAQGNRWLKEAVVGHEAAKTRGAILEPEQDNVANETTTLSNRAHQARLRKAHILSSNPLW
jgi:alpha-tubulin N-acetyltransferase 1